MRKVLTDQQQISREERMHNMGAAMLQLIEAGALRGMSPAAILVSYGATHAGHNPRDAATLYAAVDAAIRALPVTKVIEANGHNTVN